MTPSTSLSHTVNNPLGYFWVPSKTQRPQQTPLKTEKKSRRARQRRWDTGVGGSCWWSAERKRDNGIGIRFIQRKGAAVISSPSPSWLRGRHAERSEGQAKRRQHCVGTVTHRHLFWHAQGRLLSVEHANCWPAVIRQQLSAGGKMRPPVTAERGDGQAFSTVSLPQTLRATPMLHSPRLNYWRKSPNVGLINGFQLSRSRELTFPGWPDYNWIFMGKPPQTFTLALWHWTSRCSSCHGCGPEAPWLRMCSSAHMWFPY